MPAYLAKLFLSHFRSHGRLELDCDGRPVALFGANGAGKTNLLEALSLFSPGRGLRRATAQDMAGKPEGLHWKIRGELHQAGRLHEIESTSENGNARQVRIGGKQVAQVALGKLFRVLWLVPVMDRIWIDAAEGRRRFLDRLTLSFHPDHAQEVLAYEKALRERNRLLREQLRDPHWYAALEAQMARAGAAVQANRQDALTRIATAQRDAETAFPSADLRITTPDGETFGSEQDLRAALQHGRFRDQAAGRTLLGPHRADLQGTYTVKGIPAAACSTGEQKALLISLILANARALAQDFGQPPILLLDEVAAHLDAQRRGALYDEICALKAQAWLTGTEPEVFADLGGRAQRFEVQESNGGSTVREIWVS